MSNEEMDMKKVEQRISNYLILFEGKELTRKQTIAKILRIPISEGKVCDMCDGTKESPIRGGLSGEIGCRCPNCKGTGKLPDRDIEYVIKKCQEG